MAPKGQDTSGKIKITIITATLNSVTTLQNCISSILSQSYQNIEHIIVDGGSSDGTCSILKNYQGCGVKIISEKDDGIYDALNKGLSLATGDVIGFLHADDFYASQFIVSEIAKLFDDPDVDAIFGDLNYVKKTDTSVVVRKWRDGKFVKSKLKSGWMPAHPTLYVRSKWYDCTGGYDQKYKISADYLKILEFFNQPNFKAIYAPMVMVNMRVGGVSNRSIRSIFNKTIEDWHVIKKYNKSFCISFCMIFLKNIRKLPQFF